MFTELEFTSLLKELLPVVEAPEGNYREAKSAAEVERLLKIARARRAACSRGESSSWQRRRLREEDEADEDLLPLTMHMSSVADKSVRATQIADIPSSRLSR